MPDAMTAMINSTILRRVLFWAMMYSGGKADDDLSPKSQPRMSRHSSMAGRGSFHNQVVQWSGV